MRQETNSMRELGVFFALTLGLTYVVCWGPLALFKIPAVGLSTETRGPPWAIVLFVLGGFVPSTVGVLLTWR